MSDGPFSALDFEQCTDESLPPGAIEFRTRDGCEHRWLQTDDLSIVKCGICGSVRAIMVDDDA